MKMYSRFFNQSIEGICARAVLAVPAARGQVRMSTGTVRGFAGAVVIQGIIASDVSGMTNQLDGGILFSNP